MASIPPTMLWIIVILLLGAYFLVFLPKMSTAEKLIALFIIVGIYVGYKMMNGATVSDLIAPFVGTPQY